MMESMDAERLSQCYDAYSDRLMLYARNWLDDDEASDVIQVAFTRLMAQVITPRNAEAWLFRTVRNEAITRLRCRARRSRHHRQLAAHQAWFESHPEDLIDAATAQRILEALPVDQREVVLLRIWGQLSLRQIAAIVGGSVTTVRSRYTAALAAIRERMQRSCRTTD
jgi:RNA polymerase sigma-70 factor (ECF subfamily)